MSKKENILMMRIVDNCTLYDNSVQNNFLTSFLAVLNVKLSSTRMRGSYVFFQQQIQFFYVSFIAYLLFITKYLKLT